MHVSASLRKSSTEQTLSAVMKRVLPLAFALLYAIFLTSLPLEEFYDRANYLVYAQHSEQIIARYEASALINEPLWLLINIWLAQYFSAETVLRIIIFVPAFLVPWLLLSHNRKYIFWLMIILLAPQVIKNHIIHLRQGLGLAIFLLGYFSESKWRRWILILGAGFIHISFLVIVLIISVVTCVGQLPLSPRLRTILMMAFFVILSTLIIGISGFLGARQAQDYIDAQIALSGMGFIFWGIVLLILLSADNNFLEDNINQVAILAFYISTYFFAPFMVRTFESGITLVLISGLKLTGWRRKIFLMLILSYALIQYSMGVASGWLVNRI